MASDGVVVNNRFVGFGFIADTVLSREEDRREEDRRVVTEVFPGGPASGTLKVGDEFISIGAIPVIKESIQGDKLPTRGKIGEAVAVVIKRDGKEMPIEMTRGKVSGALTTKNRLLEDLSRGKADEWYWKNSKIQIEEVIGDAIVLYVYEERFQLEHRRLFSSHLLV